MSVVDFSYLDKYTKQVALNNVLILIGRALCVL